VTQRAVAMLDDTEPDLFVMKSLVDKDFMAEQPPGESETVARPALDKEGFGCGPRAGGAARGRCLRLETNVQAAASGWPLPSTSKVR